MINILIVEDEPLIAQRIEKFLRASMVLSINRISTKANLREANDFIKNIQIDLLMLDLNLHGKDGFELLKTIASESFQTIIISAYKERALQAFEYGVLDFISKPFTRERLDKALEKFKSADVRSLFPLKYLAILKHLELQLIPIEKVVYLKGAGNYSEVHLLDQSKELHNKSLQGILKLLPSNFVRIHKSHIVNLKMIRSISSSYEVSLVNDERIPVSRSLYHEIKKKLT